MDGKIVVYLFQLLTYCNGNYAVTNGNSKANKSYNTGWAGDRYLIKVFSIYNEPK